MAGTLSTRESILALLASEGPMTAAELTEEIGKTRNAINASLYQMRLYGTKYIRIAHYRRQLGKSGDAAAVFALGPGRDVPFPKLNTPEERKKKNARYRDKYRAVLLLRMQKRRQGSVNPFAQLIQQVTR